MAVREALPDWFSGMQDRVDRLREQDEVPHAIGVVGGHGLGGDRFAAWLQAFLMCLRPKGVEPCGECRSCRLLAADTHPDTGVAEPEGKGGQIRIASVRALIDFAQGTHQMAPRKVLRLVSAERLNTAASNALLKLLEEPPADTVLIVELSAPAFLLPTLRSRLQLWRLPVPGLNVAVPWLVSHGVAAADAESLLRLARGEPWQALSDGRDGLAEARTEALGALTGQLMRPDPFLMSIGSLLELPAAHLLRCWDAFLYDACRAVYLGGELPDSLTYPDWAASLKALLQRYTDLRFWITLYDRLERLRADSQSAYHLQWRALLESFLLETARSAHRYSTRSSRPAGHI